MFNMFSPEAAQEALKTSVKQSQELYLSQSQRLIDFQLAQAASWEGSFKSTYTASKDSYTAAVELWKAGQKDLADRFTAKA